MSWLNISGNLSSLASNVTSFTREVLHDANAESYQHDKDEDSDNDDGMSDYQDHYYKNKPNNDFQDDNEELKRKLSILQDGSNLLNTELSTKNDEIYFLQQEINNLSENHERHTKGLKQHLLDKENEIVDFATRLHTLEANHDEAMKKLIAEKDSLELQLQERKGSSNDNDWTEDWGGNADEVNDLKSQNDSLSNEVMMKEIILNSIEAKMQQISKKHIDVADFDAWLSEVLLKQQSETKPGTNIMHILSEITVPHSNDLEDPEKFKEWLQNTIKENSIYQEKIDKLENIISEIEITMNEQSKTSFSVWQFKQWLENLNATTHHTDTANLDMLKQIESDIRDLDEEYEQFEIVNFQEWLQQIQGRIDDLEVELLNEQESREVEEQQRIVERAKLNDLFTEKENEIAMLKVELYNKSSPNSPDFVYAPEISDVQTLTALNEHLNEANARCQGLQDELKCLQQRNDDLSVSQEELSDAINQLNNLKSLSEEKEDLQNQLLRSNKKIELLEKELTTEQDDNRKLQEELGNSNFYRQQLEEQMNEMNAQISSTQNSNSGETVEMLQAQLYQSTAYCENLTNQLQISFENIQELSQQINDKDVLLNSLSNTSNSLLRIIDETVSQREVNFDGVLADFPTFIPSFRNLSQWLDSLQSTSMEMTSKCNELTDINNTQEKSISSLESERSILLDILNIVTSALDSLDLQDSNDKLVLDGQLISKEADFYQSHMNTFKNAVLKLQNDRDEMATELKGYQKVVGNSDGWNDYTINTIDDREQLTITDKDEEIVKLQQELLECQNLHSEERVLLQKESDTLRLEIADLEKSIANLKTSAQPSASSGGGMKFGALKKKLKETEEENALLLKDNQNLKEIAENNNVHGLLANMESILLTICVGLDALQLTSDKRRLVVDRALQYNDPVIFEKYMEDLKENIETLKQTQHDAGVHVDSSKDNSWPNENDNLDMVFEEVVTVATTQDVNTENKDGWEDSESWGSNFEEDSDRKLSVIEVSPNRSDNSEVVLRQMRENLLAEQTQEMYEEEISNLKENISALEKTIENLNKAAAPPQAAAGVGGGMKFGAMKRKMQELEAEKEDLSREIQNLKSSIEKTQSVDISTGSNGQIENLSKLLSEKSVECDHYHQESEQLKVTLFSMQKDMQTIQGECYQLKVMLHDQQNQHYAGADDQNVSTMQQQDQLHNLSLRLTDKTEECERLQQQCEYLNAVVLELQNDTSDMELVREECKQLKAMLTGKEHQTRVDETIMMLQQESKQLKGLLIEKDTDYQLLQKVVLEKENEVSDMELIREECKQLKQMLITTQGVNKPANVTSGLEESYHQLEMTVAEKEEEIRQKNAMLIEMENSNSDMDLLREECKQLKVMLMEKDGGTTEHSNPSGRLQDMINEKEQVIMEKESTIDQLKKSLCEAELLYKQALDKTQNVTFPSINMSGLDTTDDFSQNSFLLQVEQLEEFLKEKEHEIETKNVQLQQKDKLIAEMENTMSDIELLHSECRALKGIIKDKENDMMEIQKDLDSANDVIQSRNDALKMKSTECSNIQVRFSELQQALDAKEKDYLLLQEELTENMAQDENIHLLQTEYRNVEERLNTTTKELKECREQLFAMETHCERSKVYEAQYTELKNVLKEKEEALNSLRLQSSDTSILESETVGILQNELNQLKIIVYERENQIVEVTAVLDRKTIELQNIYNESRETIQDLERKLKDAHSCVERLNGEIESLEQKANVGHEAENDLKQEVERLVTTINELRENGKDVDNIEKLLEDERSKFVAEKRQLTNQLEAQSKINAQLEARLQTEKSKVTDSMVEGFVTESVQQHSKEMISLIGQDLAEPLECPTCSQYHQEKAEIESLVADIKDSLSLGFDNQQLATTLTDLRAVNYAIDQLNLQVTQFVSACDQLQIENEALSRKLEQQTLDNESSFVKTTEDYEFQIKDLQSQILELNEIQADYGNIGAENQTMKQTLTELEVRNVNIAEELDNERQKRAQESQLAATQVVHLEDELNKLKTVYEKRIKESEATANDVVVSECDRLREQLTKNSHSLLDKNKECDSLKLDVLQLEEQVSKLRGNEQKLLQCQKEMSKMENLSSENNALRSKLEDYEAKLESGKMEKAFLDELIRKKGLLEQEKEELLFQLNQMSVKTQEHDVLLKHHQVQYREMEAKSTRELERLRDHLVTIEENHTKDILECQEREQRLQQELDESKQVLSRKAIILQDSSKQFQEHVGGLEDQLHVLASQRDTQQLELSKCKQKIEHDAKAIYNLQSALEQLQKDKEDQYNYLMSISKRREKELEENVHLLTEEQRQAQATMSEASLAIQGIDKITLELKQKENELEVSKEKMRELISTLKDRDLQCNQMRQASDNKLDKSLICNLLLKYFEAAEDKRAAIVQVIGGLLGLSPEQIQRIGSGAVPSKVGGWISTVWGFTTPKKTEQPAVQTHARKYDTDKSFSELFVKFLENESEVHQAAINTASLTINNDMTTSSTVQMFSPATPDILAFHNNKNESLNSSLRIPAPGQEIPRVHTHHAQTALKTLLS